VNASKVCWADASECVDHSRWTTLAVTEAGVTARAGPNKLDTRPPSTSPLTSQTHGRPAGVPEVIEGCPTTISPLNGGWEHQDRPAPWAGLGIAQIEAMIGGLLQRRRPLAVVLDALCRIFDAGVEGCFSSVLLFDRTRTRIRRAVGPALPCGFNELLEGQLVSCVATMTHRLKPLGSSPIFSLSGQLVGIFAIFRCEAGHAKPCAPELLQQFSNMASLAIERTRTEEALKRSEAQLARAQQLSSTGSFSWHPATDEIQCSEELYRIFELDPTVPVTLDLIRTRVHPEDDAKFREMTARAQTGSDFACEHRLRMSNHSVKYVRLVAHGTQDEEGQLEYIGAIQDVTPRRLSDEALGKVRAELAHVARVSSLGAMTASIAHEVNQPLSGIVTNASACLRMLAADPPDLEGARETARRTIRDGKRASDIIARLRALFRKKSTPAESVDLNEATEEVIALLSSELQRTAVILRAELAEDLPAIAADRVQLQQVVLNLLMNASEAMEDIDDRPRRLTIRTERDADDGVRMSVRDVGVGLPQDSERLFQAFHTTKSGGMGIGLSVSRSIIENHRGRLWAEPNGGPGATFSFCIPISTRARARGPTSWPTNFRGDAGGERHE
jgi:signal transduction histidine kinase